MLEAAKRPSADVGTGVLAFSNQFEIATRDDPMSVQHAVVTSYAKLQGRIGFYETPFTGKVYVVDAITNNPGVGRRRLTTRKGELLGVIGKELRNELTNTWINYSIPVNSQSEVNRPDGKTATTVHDRSAAEQGKVQAAQPDRKPGEGYDGLQRHRAGAQPVDARRRTSRTCEPESPAAKAGLQPDDLIVYVDGVPVQTSTPSRTC